MRLLDGQPYLTRKALYTMLTEELSWKALARISATDQGPFGDHLRHLFWLLRDDPTLVQAIKQVVRQERSTDELAMYRLTRAGLVKGAGAAYAWRCDLYQQYFQDKL